MALHWGRVTAGRLRTISAARSCTSSILAALITCRASSLVCANRRAPRDENARAGTPRMAKLNGCSLARVLPTPRPGKAAQFARPGLKSWVSFHHCDGRGSIRRTDAVDIEGEQDLIQRIAGAPHVFIITNRQVFFTVKSDELQYIGSSSSRSVSASASSTATPARVIRSAGCIDHGVEVSAQSPPAAICPFARRSRDNIASSSWSALALGY
jgi:hypothetical protein